MIKLKFGALAPSVEEQLNVLGYTMGGEAQRIEKIRYAILTVEFYVATDGETDKMFKRLIKLIEKKAKPMEQEGERRMTNVEMHRKLCEELNKLYEKKNHDYGDSFHLSYMEEGMAMPRIRLSDKLNRFKTLSRAENQEVKDESIRDTLIDLANYAIMTVMEIDRRDV